MISELECEGKTDEILARLALVDEDYLGCLIRRYEKPLARYIRRLTNVAEDEISDILQEVFISVYKNLNDFDPELKFSSWIYRITHNQVISHHRKKQSRPQTIEVDLSDESLNHLASELDTGREADLRLLGEQVERTLAGMEEKYRDVLVLKFFEEKSYQEISDILKKPMGTIATLLSRAKKQFRIIYEKQGKK